MKQTFVQLYDAYYDDVYRYVYYKTGNRWDTDDLVSDIFRKALEKFHALPEDANAKAWLIAIARNRVIDHYRRRKDALSDEGLEQLADPAGMDTGLEEDEDVECLKRSIARLPEDDREVIRMKYFADMKYREIGEVLGKSEEAVKVKGYRLLKKLAIFIRHCLQGGKTDG